MKLTYDELQIVLEHAKKSYAETLKEIYGNEELIETKLLAIEGFIARLNGDIIFNKAKILMEGTKDGE